MTYLDIVLITIWGIIALGVGFIAVKLLRYDANHNRKPGPPPSDVLKERIDQVGQIRMNRTEIRRIKKLMQKNPKLKHLVK